MKALSGREFTRLLESHGWSLQRVNGSHHIYAKAGSPVRISVPIHSHESLKIGLGCCHRTSRLCDHAPWLLVRVMAIRMVHLSDIRASLSTLE